MAKCNTCGNVILFGGHRENGLRFCGKDCLEKGQVLLLAKAIPEETVAAAAREVHMGLCPVCGGSGPVDLHRSHEIWSLLLVTQWKTLPRMSCRPCAVKRQMGGLVFSLLFGWWGFPWGFVMTPVQLVRNLSELASPPNPAHPSRDLQQQMRMVLAEQSMGDDAEKPEA